MAGPLAVSRPRPAAWPLWRHDGPALVAFGPDGRTLASAGEDGALRLADLELATPTFTVDLGGPATALALTASVAVVAVGATVRAIHVHGGRETWRLELDAPVVGVAVSADGATVAAATRARLVRARVATGRRAAEEVSPAPVTALAFGDGGLVLVTEEGALQVPGRPPVDVGGPVRALRRHGDGWIVRRADGALLDAAGAPLTAGTWSAADAGPRGRVFVGGPAGWGTLAGAEVVWLDRRPVLDLAAHPGGEHVGLVDVDGAVGIVPIP